MKKVEANHHVQHQYPQGVRFCPLCAGELSEHIVLPDYKEQKVCARCGFIYFMGPKLVAGTLVIDDRGRVLLLRRGIEPQLGRWTFPGGYVDEGEAPSDCAIRETEEEVRMKVALGGVHGVYFDRNNPRAVVIVYRAEAGAEPPGLSLEATEVRYFAPGEIPWEELAFKTTWDAMVDWVSEATGNNARAGKTG